MKFFSLAFIAITLFAQKKPDPVVEQQELNTALAEAGNSPVDYTRALEKHLAKYPDSAQRATIEAALAKSAIEAKDDKRILLYGEKVLATNPDDLQVLDRVIRTLLRHRRSSRGGKSTGLSPCAMSTISKSWANKRRQGVTAPASGMKRS